MYTLWEGWDVYHKVDALPHSCMHTRICTRARTCHYIVYVYVRDFTHVYLYVIVRGRVHLHIRETRTCT